MLALRFSLTPAQTEALLVLANDIYVDSRGPNNHGVILPDWESSHFVATMNRLIQKGLISHDPKRQPSFQATEEGRAIARLIESHCEKLLGYRERAGTTRQVET